jgi:protein KRI1
MPTRFRYSTTAKSSYGLTPTEILLADDKDLNEYVGLKKLAPYRKQRDTWDAKRSERLREFKKKLSGRVRGVGVDINEGEHLNDGKNKTKKRKGKKERMREKAVHAPVETDAVADERETDEPVRKKRRRQKKSGEQLAE